MAARRWNQLRPLTIEPFASQAPGSVMITQGQTRVLCTASISEQPPNWLKRDAQGHFVSGWVTAEYAMLPGSTNDRKRRGPDGRSTEIQRLIARSLRAAVDLSRMPGLAVTCDCDVVCADGGTRTASITGAWVALAQALAWARQQGRLTAQPLHGPVAAVSVGVVEDQLHLDLDYPLDVRAQVDMNIVANHRGELVEVQGTGEHGTFSRGQLDDMITLALRGIRQIMRVQRAAVRG